MGEVIALLCTLIIFAAVVVLALRVLIGWAAMAFRMLTGGAPPPVCAGCGGRLNPIGNCLRCKEQGQAGPILTAAQELDLAERLTNRLHHAGLLNPEGHRQWLAAAEAERKRIQTRGVRVPHSQVDSRWLQSPERPPEQLTPGSLPPGSLPPGSLPPGSPPSKPRLLDPQLGADMPASAGAETPPEQLPIPGLAASVARRAEEYALRQAEHAASPVAPPPPRATRPPARPLAQLLSAFLEEKNIRWGEIVGGLLIVGCSIALVRSFWAEIAARPFLKFGIFNSLTAALFGLGLYSHRRWRLPHTSRGLLTIAMVLVPLNCLAIAAFGRDSEAASPMAAAGELASLALFTVLTAWAARVLAERWRWVLVIGVVVPSAAELLLRRVTGPEVAPLWRWILCGVPVAVYLGSTSWLQRGLARGPELDEGQAHEVYRTFGVISFAAALPWGLLAARLGGLEGVLRQFAPLASAEGIPSVALGLTLAARASAPRLASVRTTAVAIAVLGAAILCGGLVLAWPDPPRLLSTAILAGSLLALLAAWQRIALLWIPAWACATVGFLVAAAVLAGELPWAPVESSTVAHALSSAASGRLLLGWCVPWCALAVAFRQFGRGREWRVVGCLVLATLALCLGLVGWHGWGVAGDPEGAVAVFGLAALALLAAAPLVSVSYLAWAGAGAALVATWQGTHTWGGGLPEPWLCGLLIHASLMGGIHLVCRWVAGPASDRLGPLGEIAGHASLAGTLAAGGVWLMSLARPAPWELWGPGLGVAALWLAWAWQRGSRLLFAGFQVALALAAAWGGTAVLARQDWFQAAGHPSLDPWTLQTQGLIWLGLGAGWLLIRLAIRRRMTRTLAADIPQPGWLAKAGKLVFGQPFSVDHGCNALVLALLLALAAYAVAPGVAQEVSPRYGRGVRMAPPAVGDPPRPRVVPPLAKFEIGGIPHQHARDPGTWLLLAGTALVFTGSLWERFLERRVLAILVASLAAPLVLAAPFERDVAAATALIWTSTVYLLLTALPVWFRGPLWRRLKHCAWPGAEDRVPGLAARARGGSLLLALTPLAGVGLAMAGGALLRMGVRADVGQTWWILTGVMWAAALVAWALGRGTFPVAARPQTARPPASGPVAAVALSGGESVPLSAPPPAPDPAGILAVPPLASASSHSAGLVRVREVSSAQRKISTTLWVLAVAPWFAWSAFLITAALKQSPILGPEPGSFFKEIGLAATYALPLVMLAGVLIGHALRERSAGFALAGGLVTNAAATVGYILALAPTLNPSRWIRLAELNGGVAAVFALAWLLVRRRSLRYGNTGESPLLQAQVLLGGAFLGMALLPLAGRLFLLPAPHPQFVVMSDWGGWLAWGLAALAAATAVRFRRREQAAATGEAPHAGVVWSLVLPCAWAACTLLAMGVCRWDSGNWLGYHVWLVLHGGLAVSAVALAGRWQRAETGSESRTSVSIWADMLGMVTAALALRAAWQDPQAPWWSTGALLGLGVWTGLLAVVTQRRGPLAWGAALIGMGVGVWWFHTAEDWALAARPVWSLFAVQVIAAGVSAVGSGVVELKWLRRRRGRPPAVACHEILAALAISVVALQVALGIAADLGGAPWRAQPWLDWLAWSGAAAASAVCLWDVRARYRLEGLYLVGLVALAMMLDHLNLRPRMSAWTGTSMLAAWSLGTSYLWSRRRGLAQGARLVGIPPDPAGESAWAWLTPLNYLLAAVVVALAVWVDLTFAGEQLLRLLTAKAAVLQALSVGLLARGRRRSQLQTDALVIGAVGSVVWGWAWLEPGTVGEVLLRTVVASLALAVMSVVYGLGLVKLGPRKNEWTRAAWRLAPPLVAVVAVCLVFLMAQELWYAAHDMAVPLSPAAVALVVALFTGSIAAALAAAVLPGRDPLHLSERGRTAYVYAAEILGALLFLHIRLCMPWLFHGWFTRYWPLVVMAVAYFGAGFSELFRRWRQPVLAEPLERTGAFLPLLPVLAFAALPSQVDYALLLLSAAVLYTSAAVTRRSLWYSLAAALAANASLWSLLSDQEGWRFLEHPQVWVIPPALSVLVATWFNRQRLTEAQLATSRYASAISIYVASTADIFIQGVAQAPWLPVVLAGLSLAGIFAGILLRVRAFLFLGLAFLVLAIFTMIWHAAVDLEQTWIWYASGIVTGVLIILMFAVFEKRRQDVLRLVEDLRHWHA